MIETNLAWAAGFIDGEGSIFFVNGKSYSKNGKSYKVSYPVLSVSNTEEKVILHLTQLFGGHSYKWKPKKPHFGEKTVYAWRVTCRKAYNVCKLILPYLQTRKKQGAQKIVDYYEKEHKGYLWWTQKEVITLKANYTQLTKCELLDLLPKRSWKAIENKASRLGFKRRNVT